MILPLLHLLLLLLLLLLFFFSVSVPYNSLVKVERLPARCDRKITLVQPLNQKTVSLYVYKTLNLVSIINKLREPLLSPIILATRQNESKKKII